MMGDDATSSLPTTLSSSSCARRLGVDQEGLRVSCARAKPPGLAAASKLSTQGEEPARGEGLARLVTPAAAAAAGAVTIGPARG
jgi:hypothetical protein